MGDSNNLVNYRPLALLNKYYKLFKRMIATAFRHTLVRRVHLHQHGFVPSREIDVVIEYFMAAQASLPISPGVRDAVKLFARL